MMMKRLLFVIVCLCLWAELSAQKFWEQRPEVDLNDFILELFPVQDEDLNYEDIYEALFQLYQNPLNLNTTERDELASLFVLSDEQITAFLAHREQFGEFLSIYELQYVPTFDAETIRKLRPFVVVAPKAKSQKPLLERITSGRNPHYLILRYDRTLEQKQAYQADATDAQRYLGTPERLYARYRLSRAQDFSFGFTLEKDAGEQLVWDNSTRRYFANYVSYHAFFQNKGRFKSIAIGDYQLQFGQGLLLSAGFNIGKGSETVKTIRRTNLGVRPYTSTLESGFFRGAAATYAFNDNWELTGFYSRLRRDGSQSEVLDSLDTAPEQFIETLRVTGLHRTAREIEGKGLFLEQNMGANLLFSNNKKNLQLGAIALRTHYDLPFQRAFRGSKDPIRYQFEFSGQQNYNLGLHGNYIWRNFSFFAEAAQSRSGGRGLLAGFTSTLSPQVEMAMLYRNYGRDFHTFFGTALGEGTRNINESGIYWGIKIQALKGLNFAAYYDYFRFPWLRFRVDAPSDGYEYLLRADYKINREASIYFQFREERKARNLSSDDSQTAFRAIDEALRKNYILNFDYRPRGILSLKTRLQFSSFNFAGQYSQGYALAQDFSLDLGKLRLDARFAIFDTDDFDNRQYVYERDVLWAFSIPAYNGVGLRNYILATYKLSEHLQFWLRYARFDFRDRDIVGTGAEAIEGTTRSEIKAQVKIKF